MFFRTDLAIEASELQGGNEDGVSMQAEQHGSMKVTRMRVKTKKASGWENPRETISPWSCPR